MSFPFDFQENFESGSGGNFNGETDVDAKLNFRHYTQLVASPPHTPPYRGAYAMHIDLSGGTNDAYVNEDDGFDHASEVTRHLRFYFYASGLTMAASDRFDIFELHSAGAVEAAIGIVNTAGTIQIGASETAASAQQLADLIQNQWHCIEMTVLVDQDADADGTIDFYLDGAQVGSQITGLTATTTTTARFGAIGIDAGTTAGHLLFDEIVYDDARVYGFRSRYPQQMMLTDDGHMYVGGGRIKQVTLWPGAAADCQLLVYDTDEANTNDAANLIIPPILNTTASVPVTVEVDKGIGYFQRGCYVSISPGTTTNPRALISFDHALTSEGLVKQHARRRSHHGVS
jgi:hypothetical protein